MSFLNYGIGESKRWYYPSSAFIIAATRIAVWALFYPHIQTMFNLETTASIILVSTFTGVGSMVLGPPVAGFILDKYGPKIPFFLSAFITLIGYFVLAAVLRQTTWSAAMPLWYTGGFLIGFGAGLYSGAYTSTVAKWFPDRLGVAMALGGSGVSVGTMVYAPLIAAIIVARGFTSEIFMILGFIGFASIAIFGIIPWKMPENEWKPAGWVARAKTAGKEVVDQKQYTFAEATKDKRFWILAGGFIGASFSYMFFAQNVTMIIIEGLTKSGMERADILATVVPYYLSLVAFTGLMGRFCWGWILDKLGPFVALPLMYFTSGVLIWVFYMGYTSAMFIYVAGGILMFVMSGEGTLHYASVPAVFGRRHIGKIMSTLNSMSVGIGITCGGFVGAYIRDVTGGFKAALILAVTLRMIGTLFALTGYRLTKKIQQQEKKDLTV
ncbi:MAG: MFS transporter [Firmicutes bacterium]|nr:MFS transporter [Bacillota bacterium]